MQFSGGKFVVCRAQQQFSIHPSPFLLPISKQAVHSAKLRCVADKCPILESNDNVGTDRTGTACPHPAVTLLSNSGQHDTLPRVYTHLRSVHNTQSQGLIPITCQPNQSNSFLSHPPNHRDSFYFISTYFWVDRK